MLVYLFFFVFLLLSVSFFTLFERNLIRLFQFRIGPHYNRYFRILQPISDGVKLFIKSGDVVMMERVFFLNFFTLYIFFFSFLSWMILGYLFYVFNFSLRILFYLVMFGLMVFPVIFIGWVRGSIFTLLGGLRLLIQVVSYEILVGFVILIMMKSLIGFDMYNFNYIQFHVINFFPFFVLFILFIFSVLIDLNRTPFDLSESEDLVSGYNLELRGGYFSLFFLGENIIIIFFCFFISFLFFGGIINLVFMLIINFLLLIFIILVRVVYPRLRYDHVIVLCWKYLIIVLLMVFFFFFFFLDYFHFRLS